MRPRNVWIGLLLVTIVLRLPYLLSDRQVIDESYYSTVGLEVLNGGDPYTSVVDRKPPLLFYSYAAFFGMVGEYNFIGLHLLALLWTLATMGVLFLIGRRLFDWRVGAAVALFYSVFLPNGDYRNQAMNGEMLMNLPVVLALAIAFSGTSRKSRLELFVAGGLLAMAFLYKQPAALAAVPIGLYLLLPAYRKSRSLSVLQSFMHAALLTLGYAGALGLFAWWLDSKDLLDDALFWTFQTDFVHGPSDPEYWRRLVLNGTLSFVLPMIPLLVCAAASLAPTGRDLLWSNKRAEFQCLLLLLVSSWLAISASGRFGCHYFIQMLPPLCLLGGPVLVAVLRGDLVYRFALLRPKVLVGLLVFMFVGFTIAQAVAFEVRFQGGEAPAYVRSITEPDDRIFVWGPSPDFYLDAHRAPASRYASTYPLTGFIFGSPLNWDPSYDTSSRIHPDAWEQLRKDLEHTLPKVLVDEYTWRGGGKYALARYAYLRELVQEEYELAREFPEARVYVRRR